MLEILTEILNLSLLAAAGVAFLSALIQGYSGFGGGLIIIPILAILFSPIESIAITALAAIFGTATLLPQAVKKAQWSEAAPVSIALAIAIPIGLSFLVAADPILIRRGMGVFILAASAVLISGWTYPGKRNLLTSITAGAITGGVTGSFGIPGGPFMVIYYLSAPVEPAVQRANLIISVGVAIVFLIGGLFVAGAYTPETIMRAIVIVPIFVAGSRTGQYLFKVAPTEWFKKVTFAILIATGISILLV